MQDPSVESLMSRVGQSLFRIQGHVDRWRRDEAGAEDLFEAWQQKWSGRREQITRRLEVLESQLTALEQQSAGRPQLAVFNVPQTTERTDFAETVSFIANS